MITKRSLIAILMGAALALAVGCGGHKSDSPRSASTGAGSTAGGSTVGVNLTGTAGDDVLTGTPQQDVISGLGGNDTITGLEEADVLNGDDGDDTIDGGDGDDLIDGGAGNDTLAGGDGADTLIGGDSGDDALYGGAGDDLLLGGAGADTLDGGDGEDTVSYATSTAAVTVDLANQTVSGGDAAGDVITSIENARGGVEADILTGVDGAENTFEGGPGADQIDGGYSSLNTASYEHSPGGVTVDLNVGVQSGTGDEDGDLLVNVANVRGSAFDDVLTGIDQAGILSTLEGGPGADTFTVSPNSGGNISYEHSPDPVVVDLETDAASGGDANGDDISNSDIDGIYGSKFDDELSGSEIWGTRLFGLDGNDVLKASSAAVQFWNMLDGGEGDDQLQGGQQSSNYLRGGPGADTIVGGDLDDVIFYDPADVSYDFAGGAALNAMNLLVVEQDVNFAQPGPSIANMTDMAVPQSGGPVVTVYMTPADLAAISAANQIIVDPSPWNAPSSDAVIIGRGWTRNGNTSAFGISYQRFEGPNGEVLLVNPAITNVSGLVP